MEKMRRREPRDRVLNRSALAPPRSKLRSHVPDGCVATRPAWRRESRRNLRLVFAVSASWVGKNRTTSLTNAGPGSKLRQEQLGRNAMAHVVVMYKTPKD